MAIPVQTFEVQKSQGGALSGFLDSYNAQRKTQQEREEAELRKTILSSQAQYTPKLLEQQLAHATNANEFAKQMQPLTLSHLASQIESEKELTKKRKSENVYYPELVQAQIAAAKTKGLPQYAKEINTLDSMVDIYGTNSPQVKAYVGYLDNKARGKQGISLNSQTGTVTIGGNTPGTPSQSFFAGSKYSPQDQSQPATAPTELPEEMQNAGGVIRQVNPISLMKSGKGTPYTAFNPDTNEATTNVVPTNANITKDVDREVGKVEKDVLMPFVRSGLLPYRGAVSGELALSSDVFGLKFEAFKNPVDRKAAEERVINFQVAQSLIPDLAGLMLKMTNPNTAAYEAIKNMQEHLIPEETLPVGQQSKIWKTIRAAPGYTSDEAMRRSSLILHRAVELSSKYLRSGVPLPLESEDDVEKFTQELYNDPEVKKAMKPGNIKTGSKTSDNYTPLPTTQGKWSR